VIGRVATLLGAAFVLAAAPCADAQPAPVVQTERRGDGLEVRAQALIETTAQLVWQVISDYERLPEFIPGIHRSTVLERRGERLLLQQSGEARFLFFAVPIEVRLEVHEQPPDRITSRAVGGNLRRMNGRYEIHAAAPGAVQLRYFGAIEPDFALPPIVGHVALRASVEEQFEAMVREIRRRAAGSPAR
jgi:ribosome-associated toxin RatA of RatAB toxin-antitoxin module